MTENSSTDNSKEQTKSEQIYFRCTPDLKNRLTEVANEHNMSRSALIIELVRIGLEELGEAPGDLRISRMLGGLKGTLGYRIATLERWQKEMNAWKEAMSINVENLEQTLINMLNERLSEIENTSLNETDENIPHPSGTK